MAHMHSASQIYKALENLSHRHEHLRKKFLDFFKMSGYFSTEKSDIVDLAFEDHFQP